MKKEVDPLRKQARIILSLLMSTNGGPVANRLIEYQLWGRFGMTQAQDFHSLVSVLRRVTGLGITRRGDFHVLCPARNTEWCVPEKWNLDSLNYFKGLTGKRLYSFDNGA